jgi:hypothetical protein
MQTRKKNKKGGRSFTTIFLFGFAGRGNSKNPCNIVKPLKTIFLMVVKPLDSPTKKIVRLDRVSTAWYTAVKEVRNAPNSARRREQPIL